MKTRYKILIVLVIISLYVTSVELDNYFNGSLHQTSIHKDKVKWLDDPNFCKESKGVWNSTVRGCYGLYEMCEENGGIPRFLKKSLGFPDIEENKPVEYLMDCYYDHIIEVNYLDQAK